jgi:hypothetical protein
MLLRLGLPYALGQEILHVLSRAAHQKKKLSNDTDNCNRVDSSATEESSLAASSYRSLSGLDGNNDVDTDDNISTALNPSDDLSQQVLVGRVGAELYLDEEGVISVCTQVDDILVLLVQALIRKHIMK